MTGQAETGDGSGGQGGRIMVWGGAAALLLAPAIASLVSDEMAWGTADFILVALILAAACGAWELAMRRTGSRTYAAAAVTAAGTAFLLLLVNGAVGFIGSEDNVANLVFLAVPAVALGGAVIVRFRPPGMARAMAVTAGAQVVAGLLGAMLFPDLRGFAVGTALFVPLWLLSAWLFRRAARDQPPRSGAV